jgi:hypothetical protein
MIGKPIGHPEHAKINRRFHPKTECAASARFSRHRVALVIVQAFEMTPTSPLAFGEELRVFIFGLQLV